MRRSLVIAVCLNVPAGALGKARGVSPIVTMGSVAHENFLAATILRHNYPSCKILLRSAEMYVVNDSMALNAPKNSPVWCSDPMEINR